MSQEGVQLVKQIYDGAREYTAFVDPEGSEADWEGRRSLYDPEFEFHAVIEGNRLVQRGTDGYLTFMRDWLEPWESYTISADEFFEVEPDRVAVTTRHRGRLKDGGPEIRSQGVDIWTVRGGHFLRLEAYLDREAGLEAAGLRE
jgi:hypothetical protein